MPGRNDVTIGSGAMTARKAPHQQATPQQSRGSATHPVAKTRADSEVGQSVLVKQSRFDKPRSET